MDKKFSADKAQKKAGTLFAKGSTVFVCTNGSHGHPDVRAMSVAKSEKLRAVWFLTSLAANKLIEIVKDPKCMLYSVNLSPCEENNFSELRLWGSLEILDDPVSRKAAWSNIYKAHFPEGMNDPNLRVLRFTSVSGRYSDEKSSSVFNFE